MREPLSNRACQLGLGHNGSEHTCPRTLVNVGSRALTVPCPRRTQKAAEFDFEGDLDLAPIRPAIE